MVWGFPFELMHMLTQTVVTHAQIREWAALVPSPRQLRHQSAVVSECAGSHWIACCKRSQLYGMWIIPPGSCYLLRLSKGQSRLLWNREIPWPVVTEDAKNSVWKQKFSIWRRSLAILKCRMGGSEEGPPLFPLSPEVRFYQRLNFGSFRSIRKYFLPNISSFFCILKRQKWVFYHLSKRVLWFLYTYFERPSTQGSIPTSPLPRQMCLKPF